MKKHKRIERKQTATPQRPGKKITSKLLDEFLLATERKAEMKAKTTPHFNFDDGVQEIIKLVRKAPADKMIFIAVYGHSGGGKTYLIEKLKKEFNKVDMVVNGCGSAPHASDFEIIKRSASPSSSFPDSGPKKRVLIFHCAWDRLPKFGEHEDPNVLAEKILNRKINLNIGIYNPRYALHRLIGEYDLVIRNENAVDCY